MLLTFILKPPEMKKNIFPIVIIIGTALLISCSRSITTYEAANGKAKCGRTIR